MVLNGLLEDPFYTGSTERLRSYIDVDAAPSSAGMPFGNPEERANCGIAGLNLPHIRLGRVEGSTVS